jgi:hypothetical protein
MEIEMEMEMEIEMKMKKKSGGWCQVWDKASEVCIMPAGSRLRASAALRDNASL